MAVALVGAALAGCAGNPTATGPKETTLVGSSPSAAPYVSPGAVGGDQTGDPAQRGPAVAAAPPVSSAAIGSMIGNRIGAGLDDDDKQRAYAAQVQALEQRRHPARRSPGAIPTPAAMARS